MFCRKCGQSIEESSKFCPFCGAPTTPTSTESTQPTPPPQPAPPAQPASPVQPGYGYVPTQSVNNNANQFQQPTQGYANPAYDYASVQTPYGANTLAIERSKKWPVLIPILMLLSAILTAAIVILQFDTIIHIWESIAQYFGALLLLLICMIVFFAKTKKIPLISAVFHTLLFLIMGAVFVVALIGNDVLPSWEAYWPFYLCPVAAFLMIVLYLIGAGIGRRSIVIGLLYTLCALAFIVLSVYSILLSFANYMIFYGDFSLKAFFEILRLSPTETEISILCSLFYLVPACLGFIIALFSLPSRKVP